MFDSDWTWIIIAALVGIAICIGLIVLVIIVIIRLFRKHKSIDPKINPQWYLNPILNNNDNISQGLMLVSYGFIIGLLNLLNRSLPNQLDWQAIIIIWAVLGILYAVILKNVYIHTVALIALGIGVVWQLASWTEQLNTSANWLVPFLLWWFVSVYAVGTMWLLRKPLQRFYVIYQVLAIVATLTLVFVLSTRDGIGLLSPISTATASLYDSLPVILVLIVLAGISVASLMFSFYKKTLYLNEAIILAVLVVSALAILLTVPSNLQNAVSLYNYNDYGSASLNPGYYGWSFVFNVASLLLPVAVMLSGVIRQEKWRVNLGVVGIFIICLIKYFDWFFTFMDKSVFFILAGALLLGLGYFLERVRRYVVTTQIEKQL